MFKFAELLEREAGRALSFTGLKSKDGESHVIPNPMVSPVQRELPSSKLVEWQGCEVVVWSSHHAPVLVSLVNSGETEKLKSNSGEVSGPHVVMGKGRDEGGVCKAERVALDADEELNVRPKLLLKLWSLCRSSEIPIAGDADGVNW